MKTETPLPLSHPRAILFLLLASALWGTSFASIKICGVILMEQAGAVTPSFGPVLFSAVRFTLAALLTFALWPAARSRFFSRGDWIPLLKVSVPMAAGFLLQGAGLSFTTATTSGFITSLCVCFTPLLEWLIMGRRPTWRLGVAIALAFIGTSLLTGGDHASLKLGPGEILTLLSVLAYTVQIIHTGDAANRLGPARLTAGSFLFTALAGWATAFVMAPTSVVPALSNAVLSGRFWTFLLITIAFATLGASILMNLFQRHVRPTEASIVYTTEPLFACTFAIMWIGWSEFPGTLGSIGAALMIVANLVVVIRRRRQRLS